MRLPNLFFFTETFHRKCYDKFYKLKELTPSPLPKIDFYQKARPTNQSFPFYPKNYKLDHVILKNQTGFRCTKICFIHFTMSIRTSQRSVEVGCERRKFAKEAVAKGNQTGNFSKQILVLIV